MATVRSDWIFSIINYSAWLSHKILNNFWLMSCALVFIIVFLLSFCLIFVVHCAQSFTVVFSGFFISVCVLIWKKLSKFLSYLWSVFTKNIYELLFYMFNSFLCFMFESWENREICFVLSWLTRRWNESCIKRTMGIIHSFSNQYLWIYHWTVWAPRTRNSGKGSYHAS